MMKKPAMAVVGILLAVPGSASAYQRTGDLRGQIVDSRTSQPIAGVEISFVQVDFSARTDEAGNYSITNIPAGRYTLLVRGIGFKPAIAPQHMLLGDTVNVLDFELDPTVTELPTVSVTANEAARRGTYAANVLSSADLPEGMDLIQALQGKVAGLNITSRSTNIGAEQREERGASLRGLDRQVLWVVDGTVITPPLTFEIRTSQVACVEVRRGASAAQRFARTIRNNPSSRGYSGVILVWTHGTRAPMPEECLSG